MCQLYQQTFALKPPLAQGEEEIENVVGEKHFFSLVLLLTVADFGSVSLWGAIGFNIWFGGEQSVVQG